MAIKEEERYTNFALYLAFFFLWYLQLQFLLSNANSFTRNYPNDLFSGNDCIFSSLNANFHFTFHLIDLETK